MSGESESEGGKESVGVSVSLFFFLCLSLKLIQGHKSNKIRHSINCHCGYILFS